LAFDGSTSSDTEAPIFRYEWQLPDGTTVQGPTTSCQFPQNGVFDVRLSVTDTAQWN
jgi:hypothetical protein